MPDDPPENNAAAAEKVQVVSAQAGRLLDEGRRGPGDLRRQGQGPAEPCGQLLSQGGGRGAAHRPAGAGDPRHRLPRSRKRGRCPAAGGPAGQGRPAQVQPGLLKDDKTFPYLEIHTREEFPRVEFTREPRKRGTKLYGPFASASGLRGAIQVLQKIFRFRTCNLDIHEDDQRWRWFRPCLLASIHQCTAPCNLRISKEQYRKDIRRLQRFLEGGKKPLLAQMREEMEAAARELRFEEAARLRDQIRLLGDPGPAGRAGHARAARGVSHRPQEGRGRLAEGAQAGPAAADHRRSGHRTPRRQRDGGQPGAVPRRHAFQAGLQAVQDPGRGGGRRFRQHPRGRRPAVPAAARRGPGLSRRAVDRRRQGPAQRGAGRLHRACPSIRRR